MLFIHLLLFTEIVVLVLRSFTPVHPLCAAIQSIGIVRRDIEGQGGIGRAIFPALLLHGMFDYALFAYAAIVMSTTPKPPPPDIGPILIQLSLGLGILALGALYYFREAKKQRERLMALESLRMDGAEELDNLREVA